MRLAVNQILLWRHGGSNPSHPTKGVIMNEKEYIIRTRINPDGTLDVISNKRTYINCYVKSWDGPSGDGVITETVKFDVNKLN